MDPGVAIGLGVLWFLFNVFGKRKKPDTGSRPRPVGLPPSAGTDATQQEGVRLQDLLRDLGKTPDQASGPRGRPAAVRLPPAEEVEDRTSLESPSREVVDLDDEAEKVAAWRAAGAEGNRRALRESDHVAFDERIRREAADATAVRRANVARLRTAVIWREILGPPISEREPGDLR